MLNQCSRYFYSKEKNFLDKPEIGLLMFYKKLCVLGLICLSSVQLKIAIAEQIPIPSEVIFIPKKILLGTLYLETTIYKPPGEGPFPLVVINHGKSAGPPGLQSRYRPGWAVRFFIERGYITFVPMRTGFSKSTGSYVGGDCNVESNGLVQAEDIAATVSFAHTLNFVDTSRSLIVGQSHGGWATLAYGASNPDSSVKGLVNFAGGLSQPNCSGWRSSLVHAASKYALNTSVPSIWFYGDNDSFFSKELYTSMFTSYNEANSLAQLVSYGVFGADSHNLFGDKDGRAIWEPHLEKFIKRIGLPVEVLYPQYLPDK